MGSPAAPASSPYFTPKKSDFYGLALEMLGDAGTPADGWDAAVVAWEVEAEAMAAIGGDVNGAIVAIEEAGQELDALGGDLDALTAAGASATPPGMDDLLAALENVPGIGPGPGALTLPLIPALTQFPAPAEVAVEAELEALVEAAIAPFENMVEDQMNEIFFDMAQIFGEM